MVDLENDLCSGCGACSNICPQCAIEMKEDEKGFLKPNVDGEQCTDCHACKNICPLNYNEVKNFNTPLILSAINNNEQIRLKSSSGGLFYLFSKNILSENGVVFGCVWDENMQTKHIATQSLTELEKMFCSKYVQSHTKNTFKEVREFLLAGKKVLYSGTPCQIAGLKSFLRKEYDNLYLIDLICHGVPSRKTFEMFKGEICKEKNITEKIININMRSKITDWGKPFTTVVSTENNEYVIPFEQNSFLESFLHNFNIGDSCINCKFNSLPRYGDITVGDFCGVDEFDKELNDKKGTSILLINSEKGKNLFEDIKNDCLIREIPFDSAIKFNQNVVKSSKPNLFRDKFFKNILSGKSLKESMALSRNNYPSVLKMLFKMQPQFVKDIIKRFI